MEINESKLRQAVRSSCANNAVEGYVMSQEQEDKLFNELKVELVEKNRPLEEVIADLNK